jgi:hypothetical protein
MTRSFKYLLAAGVVGWGIASGMLVATVAGVGPVGAHGAQGPAGVQGVPGVSSSVVGIQGPQGPAGPQGPVGDVGPKGPDLVTTQSYSGSGTKVVKLNAALEPSVSYTLTWTYTGNALIVHGNSPTDGVDHWVNELDFGGGTKSGSVVVTNSDATAFSTSNDPGRWTLTIAEL